MTAARVRITVDRRMCVGSGNCVAVDPADFELVDGKSQPVQPETALTDELTDAVLDCPVQAIAAWSPATGGRLNLGGEPDRPAGEHRLGPVTRSD